MTKKQPHSTSITSATGRGGGEGTATQVQTNDTHNDDDNQQLAHQQQQYPGESVSPYHKMEDGISTDKGGNANTTTTNRSNKGGTTGVTFTDLPSKNHDDDDDAAATNTVASSYRSILTADEIADPTGFSIICTVMFIGDMCRGVMFPTLWPLVQYLGGDERQQGLAVASFSFGRILVSPLFGSWSVTYGYRKTLLLSCSILFLGTLLYAQSPLIGRVEYLIFCQMVMGVGSGTLGVTRAFVADVTPTRNRTMYMAWLTAMQYAGFTVTPFIGGLLVMAFGEDNARAIHMGPFILSSFSSPSYLMSILCLAILFLLFSVFQDRDRSSPAKRKSRARLDREELASQRTCFGYLTIFDAAVLGCMILNVVTKGTIGSFETLGVAFAESIFDDIGEAENDENISSQTTSFAGFVVGFSGLVGCACLLSMGKISSKLSDVQMIAGGMMITALGILSLAVVDYENYEINENGEVREGQAFGRWRYMFAIFLIYALGYPVGHTAVIGLFSKLVGRRPQGTFLGWFASAGSLARMIFPLSSGLIVHYRGYDTLFYSLVLVLTISSVVIVCYKRMLETLAV